MPGSMNQVPSSPLSGVPFNVLAGSTFSATFPRADVGWNRFPIHWKLAQHGAALPKTSIDAFGSADIISKLNNSAHDFNIDSALPITEIKLNGTSSSLREEVDDNSTSEEASSITAAKVSPTIIQSRSLKAISQASKLEIRTPAVSDRVREAGEEDAVNRQNLVLDDCSQSSSGQGPTVFCERNTAIETIQNSVDDEAETIQNSVDDEAVEGFIRKVNGQKRLTSLLDSPETCPPSQSSSPRLKKSKMKARTSSRLPQTLSEILPVRESAGPQLYLKVYEKLRRAGRLQDCVVLLEEMYKVKMLDMNKIYHSKFFEACKKQRAVREAFRFMGLLKGATLSTYNMLLCVCRDARDVDGGLRVLSAAKKAGFKPDAILYTTLISTCAKAGKVDTAFKVFHEMESAGVLANTQTYGAMIDGCAFSGQIAKAFGIYGIMISKKLKPDHAIFNTLINACGRAGAIERAFDVLADMRAEPFFLKPNHVTIGALISACASAGQVDRALEVYRNMQQWDIKGTPECYTAVVHACSHAGNLDLALSVFEDMKRNGVKPDEIFFSALIDVARHSNQVDMAFNMVDKMEEVGIVPGAITYSALMGICCNTGNWNRALEVYKEVRAANITPTVSTFNALITALCDAKKLDESCNVLQEMKDAGVQADQITYSILLDACERLDEPELAFDLYTSGRAEGVVPNQAMCGSVIALCYARITRKIPSPNYPCSIGLLTGQSNEAPYEQWASWAIAVYRHTVAANVVPTIKSLSLLLGCLRIPEVKPEVNNLFDDIFSHTGNSRFRPSSILEGAGFYDPRAVALFDEAVSMGVVPHLNYTAGPIIMNAESMPSYVAEVYLVTLLKKLKQRHLAGAQLFPVTIHYLTERKQTLTATKEVMEITVSGRTGQAVAALLRRLRLSFQGYESSGKLRIPTSSIRNWLMPSTNSYPTFPSLQRHHELGPLRPPHKFLAQGIAEQQRAIRMGQVFKNSADIERVTAKDSVNLIGDKYISQMKSQINSWDSEGNNDFDFPGPVDGFRHRVSRKSSLGKRRP